MPKALMGRPMAESWLQKTQLDRMRSAGWEIVVSTAGPPLSEADLIADIAGVNYIFANGRDDLNARVIAAGTDLRGIFRTGVGVDMVDLEAAAKRGIPVCNTPGANSETVADMALTMMLILQRRIFELDAAMREGRWHQILAHNLHDRSLGIIGLGHIGKAVARRAQAFRMDVCGYDPYIPDVVLADLNIARVSDVNELFANVDVVSIHAPATGGTHHIVNAQTLSLMRKDAILINASRGDLVNEPDLLAALQDGTIAGAGLDVFWNEPAFDPRFGQLRNVVLTPHVAGNTVETTAATAHACVDNALAVEAGNWPRAVVVNGVYSD